MEHEVAISHLRDVLGIAYQHVSRTNEPVIVKRYNRTDVALVPLWEWTLILGDLGIEPKAECSCKSLAGKLDRNGIAWCESHVDEIVAGMQQNYAANDRGGFHGWCASRRCDCR